MDILRLSFRFIMVLLLSAAIFSCSKKETQDPPPSNDPLDQYVKLGAHNFSSGNLNATLFMRENPFAGYNTVAVRITENSTGKVIETATINFEAMMDMGMMQHACPVEDPTYDGIMKAYMGSATFVMPSSAGSWKFHVYAGLNGSPPDTINFDITVQEKPHTCLYSFVSPTPDSTSYFVAMRNPWEPKVGLNDFEVMVYKRMNMMHFMPVTDLSIEINPQMPSMGHGSPNNTNPVHIESGLYRGKVNFTMTGYWKIFMTMTSQNDVVLDDQGFFEVNF